MNAPYCRLTIVNVTDEESNASIPIDHIWPVQIYFFGCRLESIRY